jgi:hypothetical protein
MVAIVEQRGCELADDFLFLGRPKLPGLERKIAFAWQGSTRALRSRRTVASETCIASANSRTVTCLCSSSCDMISLRRSAVAWLMRGSVGV